MFKCEFMKCTSEFEDPSDYISHMKKRHRISEFICVLCNESFTTTNSYKRHLLKEIENKKTDSVEAVDNVFDLLPFENQSQEDFESLENTDKEIEILEPPQEYDGEENDIEKFSANVFEMILDLYGDMGLTKQWATEMTCQIQNIVCRPLLKNLLLQIKCDVDKRVVVNYINNIDLVFEELNTEHKFKSLLKKNNLYFEAERFEIAGETVDSKGYLFPLKKNIETLFTSKPDLLLDMLLTYEEITSNNENGKITSLLDAEVWKVKIKDFAGKTVLPILLYQDDIEVNNPLGSKAGKHKISTVYITFPLLDQFHISKLAYQIPASLTLSSDFSEGLYPNYYHLCLILKDLEENGIEFTIFNNKFKVHFVVATTVGDNLAQNMMLGYVMSFSVDYFCRFCVITKEKSESDVKENINLLRYNVDALMRKLGVKRDSPLELEIKSLRILDCLSVDVLHDFLEGIVKLEMCGIIRHFLLKGYFDLTFLNVSIARFTQYSRFEKKNKCCKIKKGHLDSNTLKMSASEICLFVKYFSLFVEEHVPYDDEYWIFFKILYKLLNKVMQSVFYENDLTELQKLIKEHHKKYKLLKLGNSPNPQNLLPKHHLITHYVTSIRKLGPPKYLWVMRLEGFHKCLKHYANVTSSRKNILKSLADKLQLRNSQIFFNCIRDAVIKKSNICGYICLQQYLSEINSFNIEQCMQLPTYYFISIENIRFELNDVVFTQNYDSNDAFVYGVHKIKHILYYNKNIIFLVLNLKIKEYNEDIEMLEIRYPENNIFSLLDINEIVRLPTNIKKYNNKLLVNISNFKKNK